MYPQVKSFLGMHGELSFQIPIQHFNYHRTTSSLEVKDVQWHWNENQQKSFEEVKKLITCHPVLRYYDIAKEVTL
jgi:hypothetical protein